MKEFLIRKTIWMLVILCFTSAYVISYEGNDVTVTISNGTLYYLHIMIDNQPFLYVGPGGNAFKTTQRSTAHVEAVYAPGQGKSGRAVKELNSVTTTTYSGSASHTCQNNKSSGCSVNDSDTRTSNTTRSPMSWRVIPADFQPDSTSNPE